MRYYESQLIEYKESWRDEYLKWICGFANAQGGVLYIGKRDDGSVCGVADSNTCMFSYEKCLSHNQLRRNIFFYTFFELCKLTPVQEAKMLKHSQSDRNRNICCITNLL